MKGRGGEEGRDRGGREGGSEAGKEVHVCRMEEVRGRGREK